MLKTGITTLLAFIAAAIGVAGLGMVTPLLPVQLNSTAPAVQFIFIFFVSIIAWAIVWLAKNKYNRSISVAPFWVHLTIYLFFISGWNWYNSKDELKSERFEYIFEGPSQKIYDAQLGYRYLPDTFYRQATIRIAGQTRDTIFDVTYRTDHYGRRIMPQDTALNRAVLFFGCSYVYGMGVRDTQTIPYCYYLHDTTQNVYNYALDGYGPSNALRLLETENISQQIYGDSVTGIFVYIGDHIPRVVGAKSHFNMWARNFPYYQITDDSVTYRGRFIDAQPLRAFMYKLLAQLTFIDRIFVYRNWVSHKDHYETARVLAALQQQFYRQFPTGKFYVLLHPSEPSRFNILPYLQKLNVQVIDGRLHKDTMDKMMIPHEPHPSARGHNYIADFLFEQTKH